MRQGFIAQRSAEGYDEMALAVICKMPGAKSSLSTTSVLPALLHYSGVKKNPYSGGRNTQWQENLPEASKNPLTAYKDQPAAIENLFTAPEDQVPPGKNQLAAQENQVAARENQVAADKNQLTAPDVIFRDLKNKSLINYLHKPFLS
jgi:hypothetical protein